VTAGSDPLLDLAREQSPEWTRFLAVDADLDIELDTAAGEHATGRLIGHGHRLRLEFDRPEVLAGTADRSTLTAVAAQLVQAQLRAELHGPRGRIAIVDSAHTSRVAAVLTGSPHISIDQSGWALAARKMAPATVAVRVVTVAVTALLAAAAVVRRRSWWDKA
jgi:hypothetical protein